MEDDHVDRLGHLDGDRLGAGERRRVEVGLDGAGRSGWARRSWEGGVLGCRARVLLESGRTAVERTGHPSGARPRTSTGMSAGWPGRQPEDDSAVPAAQPSFAGRPRSRCSSHDRSRRSRTTVPWSARGTGEDLGGLADAALPGVQGLHPIGHDRGVRGAVDEEERRVDLHLAGVVLLDDGLGRLGGPGVLGIARRRDRDHLPDDVREAPGVHHALAGLGLGAQVTCRGRGRGSRWPSRTWRAGRPSGGPPGRPVRRSR